MGLQAQSYVLGFFWGVESGFPMRERGSSIRGLHEGFFNFSTIFRVSEISKAQMRFCGKV